MSFNHCGQQHNSDFFPMRIGNCEAPRDHDYAQLAQYPQKCPLHCQRPSSLPYFLVSDRHGRLLPCVKQKLMSRQENSAWAQLSGLWLSGLGGCDCILRKKTCQECREEVLNAKPKCQVPIPSFFRQVDRGVPKYAKYHNQQERPCGPRPEIDPYLVYLRDLALPTIWVIGVPTSTIRQKRKKLCQDIAEELDFAYVELNDCIGNWTRRQMEAKRGRNEEDVGIQSNTIPSYRSMKPKNLCPPQPHYADNHVGCEESPYPPITFSTSHPFTTEQVLDVLKFAMVEALPANGFILDGFPCNLQEAAEFERLLYPASLALYFVAGQNGAKRSNDPENYGRDDHLIFPTRFRRKLQFTLASAEVLCSRRNYGWKVIRVLDTQNMDEDTVSFLQQVIRDNLCRGGYNNCSGQQNNGCTIYVNAINAEKPLLTPMADEQVKVIDTDKSCVASPNSRNGTKGGTAETDNDDDDDDSDDLDPNLTPLQRQLEKGLRKLRKVKPPVIWILGHPHETTVKQRETFGKHLATRLGYTYVNMDTEILNRTATTTEDLADISNDYKSKDGDATDNITKAADARLVLMSWKITSNPVLTLNEAGILEILKLGLIHYHDAKGFVLESFPCSETEATKFEEMFYPATFVIYIKPEKTHGHRLKRVDASKSKEGHHEELKRLGGILEPEYFRRSHSYHELDVGTMAQKYKSQLKALFLDHEMDLGEPEVELAAALIRKHIQETAKKDQRALDENNRKSQQKQKQCVPKPQQDKKNKKKESKQPTQFLMKPKNESLKRSLQQTESQQFGVDDSEFLEHHDTDSDGKVSNEDSESSSSGSGSSSGSTV